jgi:hypothetical protein
MSQRTSHQTRSDPVTAKMPLTAIKVLQLSHMELLCEVERAEPRLRRLLGHISTYENVSHWCQQNQKKSVPSLGRDEEGKHPGMQDDTDRNGVAMTESTYVPKAWTLSGLEAAIGLQLKSQRLVTVTATEVTQDSDSSDDGDEYEIDSDDIFDDDGIWSDDENLIEELIECTNQKLSLRDCNDCAGADDLSPNESTKNVMLQDRELWSQQPRVLSDSESEQAFHRMWL